MENATPFQSSCRAAVDAVLDEHDIEPRYEVHDAADSTEGSGRIFLRAEFARGDDAYDLYVYSEEAALNINRTWYVYEHHDFPDALSLVSAFCAFLRRCLEGENPADASRQTRREPTPD